MKKIIFTIALVICSISINANNYITVTTNVGDKIEVIVLGHNNDMYTVGRAGKIYNISKKFLNISNEAAAKIVIADKDKKAYKAGENLNKATANSKTAEDVIVSDFVLDTLEMKSNLK